MKRIFNLCRKHREALCVMLSGDLPATDRASLEQHLSACAGCQKYRTEIGKVTTLLSASRKLFIKVQPNKTARARWARDFETATKPAPSTATKIFHGFLDWTREMVRPCRWIWTGLAAVWVVVLGLNVSQKTPKETQAARRPSPEMMRALLAVEGFLPGPNRTGQEHEADPPKPLSRQPGSEQHPDSKPS
jgi:anti-sigma factor RsiW